MDSILTSVKKLLGIAEEYTQFDTDIVLHINSVFATLAQLGAGPAGGFSIADKTAVWTDFTNGNLDIEMVKSYVYLKVRLIFDPPQSSAVMESMNRMISEFEFRILVAVDPGKVS